MAAGELVKTQAELVSDHVFKLFGQQMLLRWLDKSLMRWEVANFQCAAESELTTHTWPTRAFSWRFGLLLYKLSNSLILPAVTVRWNYRP